MRTKLVFALVCIFFLTVSCQKRSLIFIFDTTGSMANDLANLKKGSDLILKTMTSLPSSPIDNYILVPFNDPEFGPAMVTRNENDFRQALNNIKVDGGGDCPEMCFSALEIGLQKGLPNSYVYVMTDAPEKDSHLITRIERLIQQKKSQVSFILTPGCTPKTFENYNRVAQISSGQVFELDKSDDILKILDHVNSTLDEDRIEISYKVKPKGNSTEPIAIDDTLKNINVVVSGGHPDIKILDPVEEVVYDPSIVTPTIDLPHVKGVALNASAGNWTVAYGSDDEHTLKITGTSTVKFKFGFTSSNTDNMEETTQRPLSDVANKVLVTVDEGQSEVKKIVKVEIVNSAGTILNTLRGKLVGDTDDSPVFKTSSFLPPDEPFFVITYAEDSKGNVIKRSSTTAIQPEVPEKPHITVDEKNVTVKVGESLTLICNVDSSAPIVVKWIKNSKKLQESTFQGSDEAVFFRRSAKKSDEGVYKCRATNSEGSETETISVVVTK